MQQFGSPQGSFTSCVFSRQCHDISHASDDCAVDFRMNQSQYRTQSRLDHLRVPWILDYAYLYDHSAAKPPSCSFISTAPARTH
jgi:hypothetical protein